MILVRFCQKSGDSRGRTLPKFSSYPDGNSSLPNGRLREFLFFVVPRSSMVGYLGGGWIVTVARELIWAKTSVS